MKKNNIIVLVVFIGFIVFGVILGIVISMNDKQSLELTCDSGSISSDNSVVCKLNGYMEDYEVSAFRAEIESNYSYEIENITVADIWEGDGDYGDIDLYTDENKYGEFEILTFEVKLSDNNADKIVIKLEDIGYFDAHFNEHELEDISKTLKVEE